MVKAEKKGKLLLLQHKRHVQLITGLFYCCQAGIANAMRKLQVSLGTQRHRRRHVASNRTRSLKDGRLPLSKTFSKGKYVREVSGGSL